MAKLFGKLKQALFPKGIKRTLYSYTNQFFRKVSPDMLEKDFVALGLGKGDFVCLHSSLSGLGHLSGGSESVIAVLKTIIGPAGTLMMPAFTGGGSSHAYVTSDPVRFKKDLTPTTTGFLCETFRKHPGVRRSLHPTHSVAVLGPDSEELITGHENSVTPFGDGTPYDKLIQKKGKVLLLNTNANSLMHRIQEITDWPNHYLNEKFTLDIQDGENVRSIKTSVHSPGPYSHMVFPGKSKKEVCFVHFPAYGLQFLLGEKELEVFRRLDNSVTDFLKDRYKWFLEQQIVHKGKVGFGQAVLFDAAPFAERIQNDMSANLSRNQGLYDRERLKRMKKSGMTDGPMPLL